MSRPLTDRDPLLLRSRLLRWQTAKTARRPVGRTYVGTGPVVVLDGLGLGLRLRGLSVDQAQAGQIVRGAVEPMVQEALRRRLSPGAVMYDVGGSVGFFSLLGARLGATVIAFEPLPGAAATIERNAALNGLSERVRVLELAAGEKEGRATLIEAGEAGWSHLADRGSRPDAHATHDVRVAALDDLVTAGEIPPPDLVKLDVEGSEVAVLDGLRQTIERHQPVFVIELHETNAEVADRLESHGYRLERLDGPGPVRDAPGDAHLLAAPI